MLTASLGVGVGEELGMDTLNKHQAIVKHSHALAKADKHGTKQMHALPDPFHTPTLTSEDGNIKNTHNLETFTNCILLLKIPHTWTNTQSNAQ